MLVMHEVEETVVVHATEGWRAHEAATEEDLLK